MTSLLKTSCHLMTEISRLKKGESSAFLEDVVIHCQGSSTVRASGLLLAAANDFWSQVLLSSSAATSGGEPGGAFPPEDFHVFLLDETLDDVTAFVDMLWTG